MSSGRVALIVDEPEGVYVVAAVVVIVVTLRDILLDSTLTLVPAAREYPATFSDSVWIFILIEVSEDSLAECRRLERTLNPEVSSVGVLAEFMREPTVPTTCGVKV